MPGQRFERHAGGRGAKRQDRLALDVDALDDRLVDVAGQIGADFCDRILHVVEGAVLVDFQAEFHRRDGCAVGQRRDDLFDAGDVGDRVLDLLGDLAFEFGRRGTRLRHRDRDDRDVDIGEARHRQRAEAHDAEQQQNGKQHDRRDRLADRPRRDVEIHVKALRSPWCRQSPGGHGRPAAESYRTWQQAFHPRRGPREFRSSVAS
jgi:hypothetical protein